MADNSKDSYFDKTPSWALQYFDIDHPKWGICNENKFIRSVVLYLKSIERSKWSDILTSTSGRSGNTRNHRVNIENLCVEARRRIVDLGLEAHDALVSIAISNRERIWGILLEGVYFVVWLDPEHEVYPVSVQ